MTMLSALDVRSDVLYMNEAQQAYFRGVLQSWKIALLNEADQTLSHMRESHDNLTEEGDLASQEEDFRLALRARDRDRKLIRKIDQSLEAIQTGEYGYCEDCGDEIGFARLDVRPTATKCIECKTVAEIKEKQEMA